MKLLSTLSGLTLLTLGAAAGFAYSQAKQWLPDERAAATGLSINGEPLSTRDLEPEVQRRAQELLSRRVTLRFAGQPPITVSAKDLGAVVDTRAVIREAYGVGREARLEDRLWSAWRTRQHGKDLILEAHVPVEQLADRLALHREHAESRAVGAKRHLGSPTFGEPRTVPHQPGRGIDVYETAERVERALAAGVTDVEVAVFQELPLATTEAVTRADVGTVVASFETRFGGPVGRDKNILRAAGLLDGVVLMPGESLSFNEAVGPRSEQNGFFSAPEIYKGEMRAGIGGGVCQVASTLYAASFFGGLTIDERRNHSRPSGYIRPGLDATVSYPVLDLRIENPFPFPIVIKSEIDGGLLRFALHGKERQRDVTLATETVGILKAKRKLERTAMLPEGEFRLKQKGKRGLVIKRLKTIRDPITDLLVTEESRDVYPAQQEIYLVGPKVDEQALPPPPGEPEAGS